MPCQDNIEKILNRELSVKGEAHLKAEWSSGNDMVQTEASKSALLEFDSISQKLKITFYGDTPTWESPLLGVTSTEIKYDLTFKAESLSVICGGLHLTSTINLEFRGIWEFYPDDAYFIYNSEDVTTLSHGTWIFPLTNFWLKNMRYAVIDFQYQNHHSTLQYIPDKDNNALENLLRENPDNITGLLTVDAQNIDLRADKFPDAYDILSYLTFLNGAPVQSPSFYAVDKQCRLRNYHTGGHYSVEYSDKSHRYRPLQRPRQIEQYLKSINDVEINDGIRTAMLWLVMVDYAFYPGNIRFVIMNTALESLADSFGYLQNSIPDPIRILKLASHHGLNDEIVLGNNGNGNYKWKNELPKYRGEAAHRGYIRISNSNFSNEHFAEHFHYLYDLIVRILLKASSYDGDYFCRTHGEMRNVDWVLTDMTPSDLGYSYL